MEPAILGSLPELPPHTSLDYKKWQKVVQLGYDAGDVLRALRSEDGDVDRAAVRLAQAYSGFHGLHCLSTGNCFGDPRGAVFREPQALSVPVPQPRFQDPPPPTDQKELELIKKEEAANPSKLEPRAGKDFSAVLLKPNLGAYNRIFPLPKAVPEELPHRRHASAVRKEFAPTPQQDAFTSLMRTCLTQLRAPWYQKKKGAKPHPSEWDDNTPPHPSAHPPLVPVPYKIERTPDGQLHQMVEWHEPPVFKAQTLDQLTNNIDGNAPRPSAKELIPKWMAQMKAEEEAEKRNPKPKGPPKPPPVDPNYSPSKKRKKGKASTRRRKW